MNILVCGAHGMIGRHLCKALIARGHDVIRGVRTARSLQEIDIDYMRDLRAEDWIPRLQGIDVVINAVGILCEQRGASFEAIHRDAPIALIDACERAGVRCFVQISAIGSENDRNQAPYMRTKRDADAHLMASSLDWCIVRPSLVVATDGDSSRFFRSMASLPVIGLPGRGDQALQPVHVDDLCDAVVRVLEPGAQNRVIVNVAGPVPMTYRSMLQAYRDAMNMATPLWLPVPMFLMKMSAAFAARLPQRVFSPDTLRMLEDGNVADSTGLTALLGRQLKGPADWFAGIDPVMLRSQAIAAWSMPALRIALALVWIVTGLLSLGVYPVNDSLALLNRVGMEGNVANAGLYGSAMLDLAIGAATLFVPGRWLWRMQFVVILAYTGIIATFLPDFLVHPFGPVKPEIS